MLVDMSGAPTINNPWQRNGEKSSTEAVETPRITSPE